MKLLPVLAVLGLALQPALALDKEAILKIAKKPHSRENLLPQLGIFADARLYDITVTFFPAEGDPTVGEAFQAREKVVKGKYLVTEFTQPEFGGDLTMVVTFDSKEEHYLKWVLLPDGEVAKSIGLSPKGSRAISWHNVNEMFTSLTIEQHSDEGATWIEVHLLDGKTIGKITGSARKAK